MGLHDAAALMNQLASHQSFPAPAVYICKSTVTYSELLLVGIYSSSWRQLSNISALSRFYYILLPPLSVQKERRHGVPADQTSLNLTDFLENNSNIYISK